MVRSSHFRWIVLSLLVLATGINYLDRIILSVLMPVIRVDLGISDAQYGYVTGAFQAAYGLGNLGFGRFTDWAGIRIAYALALGWWSAAATLHALSRHAVDLGIWRGLLGLGEGGNFPAAAKSIADWFPRRDRAFAMGICVASTNVAAMAGPPLFVAMNDAFGWRATFAVTGAAGLVLMVLWSVVYLDPPSSPSAPSEACVRWGWGAAVRHRQTWGFAIAKFLTDPVWWFYIFWLPLYLHDVRGLPLQQIGWALPVVYLMADLGAVLGGWFPGFLMRRGWQPGTARKTAMACCVVWLPVAALAVFAPSIPLAVFLFSLGTFGHQGWSANLLTTVSDVYPQAAVATVIGVGQCVASLGGLLFSSVFVGLLISRFGYTPVFLGLGTFHLLGLVCVHLLMGRLEPIDRGHQQ